MNSASALYTPQYDKKKEYTSWYIFLVVASLLYVCVWPSSGKEHGAGHRSVISPTPHPTIPVDAIINTGDTMRKNAIPGVVLTKDITKKTSFIITPIKPVSTTASLVVYGIQGCRVEYIAAAGNKDQLQPLLSQLEGNQPGPLPEGMINVTAYSNGFAIKQVSSMTGKFKVSIAYDPARIPAGYSVADIQTYWFNDTLKTWQPLKTEKADMDSNMIISTAPAEGEFINGIIKAPETPETFGYMPTTMNDIKVADPAAMVQIIEPPVANDQGTASLTYHIETPKGRNGIEPNLNIIYSSDGANGWLGEGWSMNVSKITVDTRWGVPKYDAAKETETYNLDGQMLGFYEGVNFIMPHRTLDKLRNKGAEPKEFFLRKENSYKNIQRMNDAPGDYYWLVKDKNGTKYYYGQKPSSRLGENGKVAEWYLDSVIDIHNNYMLYKYETVTGNAIGMANLTARNIYLAQVLYSFNSNTGGGGTGDMVSWRYRVDLESKKKIADDNVSARYGFLVNNDRFLYSIKVWFDSTTTRSSLVRSYQFEDKPGAFSKTLLSRITQYGADGTTEFNHQVFDYHNDIADKRFFDAPKVITNMDDKLANGLVTIPVIGNVIPDKPSAINSTKSAGNSGSFYIGVGPNDWQLFSKSLTAGLRIGYAGGNNEGINTLVDIDGDGLIDKVFVLNGNIWFRKNNSYAFEDPKKINGDFDNFFDESSNTFNIGLEANWNASVSAGIDYSKTNNTTSTYFADVNADGLMDIVSDGKVWFNHLENGIPSFGWESNLTPVAINGGDVNVFTNVKEETDRIDAKKKELVEHNPLNDAVRVWEAPFDGRVRVTGAATMKNVDVMQLSKRDRLEFDKADGVYVSVQFGDGTLNSERIKIEKNDQGEHRFQLSDKLITVRKGERIYFRVQSSIDNNDGNGAFDKVLWQPVIKYEDVYDPAKQQNDVFNKNRYVYDLGNDYIISNSIGTSISADGDLQILGTIDKKITTDTVTVQVIQLLQNTADPLKIRGENDLDSLTVYKYSLAKVLLSETYAPGSVIRKNLLRTVKSIDSGAVIFFNILSPSNIDMSAVLWKPQIILTRTVNTVKQTLMEEHIIPNHIFNDSLVMIGALTKISGKTGYAILPYIRLIDSANANGEIMCVLRNNNSVLQKARLVYKDGILQGTDTLKAGNLKAADSIYVSFENPGTDTANNKLFKKITVAAYRVNYTDSVDANIEGGVRSKLLKAGTYIFTHHLAFKKSRKDTINYTITDNSGVLIKNGQLYFGVTDPENEHKEDTLTLLKDQYISFTYKSRFTNPPFPLSENDFSYRNDLISVIADAYVYQKRGDPKFGPMYRGWGQFAYNTALVGGSAPIRENLLVVSTAGISEGQSDALRASVNTQWTAQGTTLDTREADGFNPLKAAFSMMKPFAGPGGERYWKGLDDEVFISDSVTGSSRLGINDVNIKSPFLNVPKPTGSTAYAIVKSSSSDSWTYNLGVKGIGGSYSRGNSSIESDYMDINGDRYPDIISQAYIQYTNATGKLAASERVDFIHKSASANFGLNDGGDFPKAASVTTGLNPARIQKGSVETGGNSISASEADKRSRDNVGVSASGNYNKDNIGQTWLDINGDGLPDRVTQGDKMISAQLNLGNNEFSPVFEYAAISNISKGSSITLSPGVSGLGINIQNRSIVGGMGISLSHSLSEMSLQDINNDGLIDIIKAEAGEIRGFINMGNGSFEPTAYTHDLKTGAVNMPRFFTAIPPLRELNDGVTKWKSNFNSSVGQSIGASFSIGIPIPACLYPCVKLTLSGIGASHSMSIAKTNKQLVDFDGDGYSDLLESDEEGLMKLYPSRMGRTNKLAAVTNSLGGQFTIDYKHNESTYAHPGGKWVMSGVEVNDGIEADRLTNNGYDSKNVFIYKGGKYDRYNREFLGFGEVITRQMGFDPQMVRKQKHLYDTSNYYTSGNLLSEVILDSKEAIYTFKQNEYYIQKLTGGNTFNSNQANTDISLWEKERVQVSLKQAVNGTNEGKASSLLLNKTFFKYDTYGNITRFSYKENPDDVNDNNTDYTVSVTYAKPDLINYIIGLPDATILQANTGKLLRRSSAAYDAKGKLIRMTKQLNNTESAVTTFTYDNYGNVKTVDLPENKNGQRVHMIYEMDAVVNTYVTKVINQSYGYSSESQYDFRFGLLKHNMDINSNHTNYIIDQFGRIVTVIGAIECNRNYYEGGCNNQYSLRFVYPVFGFIDNNAVNNAAITSHYDSQHPGGPGIQTINNCDGFGRSVQVKKTAETGDDAAARWIIGGRVKYDALGREAAIYYPTTSSSAALPLRFDETEDKLIAPTRITYDVLDRKLTDILPDDAGYSVCDYSISGRYQKTNVKLLDKKGKTQQVSETYTNGSGLKVREVLFADINNAGQGISPITTTWSYDVIHQLFKVVNTDNVEVIRNTYDTAGRRTKFYQVDAGTTTFGYDKAGNIASKTTAKGNITQYEYYFNRLTDIIYPQTTLNNVHYEYGDVKDKLNRIVFQSDASGAQEFEYDVMGNITYNKRTVIVPFDSAYSFETRFEYDSWNRVQQIVYTDAESVKYRYNTAGLLTGVAGYKAGNNNDATPDFPYVKDIRYDKFEKRISLTYGNGVTTNYQYDKRRRLDTLYAKEAGGEYFLNMKYGYDNINNITSLSNKPKNSTALISSFSQAFAYDNLNRLTGARGNWAGINAEKADYELKMVYDQRFNIAEKVLTLRSGTDAAGRNNVYKYDSLGYKYQLAKGKPHQVNRISSLSIRKRNNAETRNEQAETNYRYDQEGRDTSSAVTLMGNGKANENVNGRQLIWDEDNRVKAIAVNGSVSNYIYDAHGERVVKMSTASAAVYVNGPQSSTYQLPVTVAVYVNPYLSMRNGGGVYTKHIYIGSERIASQLTDKVHIAENAGAKDPYGVNGMGVVGGDPTKYVSLKFRHDTTVASFYQRFRLPRPAFNHNAFVGFRKSVQPAVINPFVKDNGNVPENLEISNEKNVCYFYHSNHINSVNYVTGMEGKVVQHLEYLPYGEVFMEQRGSYSSQYSFNAKEQDEETGLYYYGARYYDPATYQWLGVDPMVEKYAGMSGYNFNLGNPVKMLDTDGNDAVNSVTWTNKDAVKYQINRTLRINDGFIFEKKAAFINYYRKEIIAGAMNNKIDPVLLAGVAFTEYGGKTHDMKMAIMKIRENTFGNKYSSLLGKWGYDPKNTSFGDVAIQIRRACEVTDCKNLTNEQVAQYLNNPVNSINIAAAYLGQLSSDINSCSAEDIMNVANQYNTGPNKQGNGSYGRSIMKHMGEILKALNTDKQILNIETLP